MNYLWIRTIHRYHCIYSTGPSNNIFVRDLFVFNSFYIVLIEWKFYDFVIHKCMSTTVCDNATVQFTFFLVMRSNITIAMNFSSLKFENEQKKHVKNIAQIWYMDFSNHLWFFHFLQYLIMSFHLWESIPFMPLEIIISFLSIYFGLKERNRITSKS